MTEPSPESASFETTVRVRYADTDAMGVVYHGRYLEYFEVARTEWLRSRGVRYADVERTGVQLAVVEVAARYRRPAHYDDLLRVCARLLRISRVQLEIGYEVYREEELLVEGRTRLACIEPGGRVRRLPPELRALE